MSGSDVPIFAEHCPNHGAKARRYWVESAGEGYELPYIVTVEYGCRRAQGCLQSQNTAQEPREVRDFAGHRIPKTAPPRRT
jgi:hypothetical protein